MNDDLISRKRVMEEIVKEYNRKATKGNGLQLAWIEKAVNSVEPVQTEDDMK